MGFELLQPFLEFAFAYLGLALVVAGAFGFTIAILYVPWWVFDKAEDFADRLEASWNISTTQKI